MRAKASEVRRELTEATVKYGSRHPTVVALRAQLSDVNRQIGNETARTVSSAENSYRVALSREQSIEASLGAMKGGAAETNTAEITLRELEREAQANKALFESFLDKIQGNQRAGETSDLDGAHHRAGQGSRGAECTQEIAHRHDVADGRSRPWCSTCLPAGAA